MGLSSLRQRSLDFSECCHCPTAEGIAFRSEIGNGFEFVECSDVIPLPSVSTAEIGLGKVRLKLDRVFSNG